MKIVREQGVGNMIGKSKPRSRNLYDEVVQLRARCEEYEEEIAALEDEVEALKKELARYKWVSVDDKLPEVDKEVLCRNEYGDMTLGHFDDDEDMWETDVEGFNVRYWMFLPFEDVQEGEIL